MASKANAAEVVSRVEYNQLKRKLEEEVQEEKKKVKLLKGLVACSLSLKFPTKRAQIRMTVPNFAKAMEEMKAMKMGAEPFSVFSDPVNVFGFQWKLEAYGTALYFGFFLHAFPPTKYADGSFEFHVDYSLHLLGNRPSHDILEAAKEGVVAEDDELKIKRQMKAFPDNFLQPDGSIQVGLDFSVQSAKFCKDDDDEDSEEEENEESGNNNKENGGKEAGKK